MAATDDYNLSASRYKDLFTAQALPVTVAALNSGEQFDRDNLLYFIENNFKSNVKGGVTLENLRAFLHILVKSTRNQTDDGSRIVLATRLARCFTLAADRYYYGDTTYAGASWVAYTTNVSQILAQRAYLGVVAPFDLHYAGVSGTVTNVSGSGDVEVSLYYTDVDSVGASSYLANPTLVGSVTIDATQNTSHSFDLVSSNTIPKGKIAWVLLRNAGFTGSSTDYVYLSHSIYGSTSSINYTP